MVRNLRVSMDHIGTTHVIEVKLSLNKDFEPNSQIILDEIASDIWRTIMGRYPEISDCHCIRKEQPKGVRHEDNHDY